MSDNGLITIESNQSVDDTVASLQTAIKEAGFLIPAVINHAANAAKVDKQLRPTQLIILGNPNIGTNFMQANQQCAIDLPQKILVWEAEDGKVNITYNDPAYLRERHGIEGLDELFAKVAGGLSNFAKAGAA